jgi:phospholipid/cholesterol/gamma-HCH transport system substrate-binding protein
MEAQQKKNNKLQTIIMIALIAGGIFAFLKLRGDRTKTYYTYFYNIQGLQPSSPVQINGVRVGKIEDIDLEGDKVKIYLELDEDLVLHDSATASLASGGMTGDKVIMLYPGKGGNPLPEYATINSALDTSVLPMSVRMKPMIVSLKTMLHSADVGLRGFTYIINGGLTRQSAQALISLDSQTARLRGLAQNLNRKGGEIAHTIHNAAASTHDMAANNADTRQSIKDIEDKTAKQAKAPVAENFKKLGSNISALGNTFKKLGSVDSGLGNLLNKKDMYRKNTQSFDTLNRSLKGLQERANAAE